MGCSRQLSTLAGCFTLVAALGLVLAIAAFLADYVNHGPAVGGRHAEVKQNLHAIQLALERYAVDHDGLYPLFVMGGSWSDSYVVSEDWRRAEGLELTGDAGYYGSLGQWEPAPAGTGDALVMEAYMPRYPQNPFAKVSSGRLRLAHVDHLGRLTERYCGGAPGDLMVEVFGPQFVSADQPIAGDFFVHHIFNDPPYTMRDIRKETTREGGRVDFAVMSGNPWLTGNFSYYPRMGREQPPWLAPGFAAGELAVQPVRGYTLAGYGSVRTAGQDVYNRNGNYKGRYRTEDCATDCSEHQLFPDDVPCICPGDNSQPSHLKNNGGSDTLPDGVIITLDSGVKQGRYGKFLPGDDDPTPPAGPK